MIGYLRGKIQELHGQRMLLDVNGVGYELLCSLRCVERFSTNGEDVALVVYTDVKEDSITLYGFADKLERETFLLLKRVKGLGARSASEIISQLDCVDLLRAIGSADVSTLCRLRGVGKKTAERIVVELRDNVGEIELSTPGSSLVVERVGPYQDAVAALEALGFSAGQAEQAVEQVRRSERVLECAGDVVREALRFV